MIPEAYLHSLWKAKRLPFHLMTHIEGEPFELKQTGIHNTNESGPDFFAARIVIGGIEWSGNVELHVKSSDWYKHNHQLDDAYNNVILHVVFENDCQVTINKRIVPTIELKEFIDWKHFQHWSTLMQRTNEINCKKSISQIDTIHLEHMLERALIDRLNRKAFLLRQDHPIDAPEEMLYFLVARAFGTKVNQQPFEEITHRLPLSLLKSIDKNKQISLIHTTSGIFESIVPLHANDQDREYKSSQNRIESFKWKKKGLRPTSFPKIRIKQFAFLIAHFDFVTVMNHFDPSILKLELDKVIELAEKNSTSFGKGFKDLLIINCIVPFLWWMSEQKEDSSIQESALDLLLNVPAEKNSVLNFWKELGIVPTSAYESQGYLEIYNEHCTKNKCLSCDVGVQILK